MNVAICFCLLACVGLSAVVSSQAMTVASDSPRQHSQLSENKSKLFEEENNQSKTHSLENQASLETKVASTESSKDAQTFSPTSNEAKEIPNKTGFTPRTRKAHRSTRTVKSSNKESALRNKNVLFQLPFKNQRQRWNELVNYEPGVLETSERHAERGTLFDTKHPKGTQHSELQERLNEETNEVSETYEERKGASMHDTEENTLRRHSIEVREPKQISFHREGSVEDSLRFASNEFTRNDDIRNYYSERPYVQQSEGKPSQIFRSVEALAASMKVPLTSSEQSSAMQKAKSNTNQSSLEVKLPLKNSYKVPSTSNQNSTVQKTENLSNKLTQSSSEVFLTSVKNGRQAVASTNFENSTIFLQNKTGPAQSSPSLSLLTSENRQNPTGKNFLVPEHSLTSRETERTGQRPDLLSGPPHTHNSINTLLHGIPPLRYPSGPIRPEYFVGDPTQKIQRSSQFIPICPEVDNITEIYWELCKDFECDEEFFNELKKKQWTEDVLRVKGLPVVLGPQPLIPTPPPHIIPESVAHLVRKTPPSFELTKSQEVFQAPNHLPRTLSDSERVVYPTNVLTKTISNDLDNSINFVNTDTKVFPTYPSSWSQQFLPNKISSNDLAHLSSFVIPLEDRTYPKGACVAGSTQTGSTQTGSVQAGSSYPGILNYPFQNPETLPVVKIPPTPLTYPPSSFEHVWDNCNNIINRKSEVPEAEKPETGHHKHESGHHKHESGHHKKHDSGHKKHSKESEEAPVIAEEAFPEFNQVVKTKLLKAHKLERDGNIIFLPETGSGESRESGEEDKSVEMVVHVVTFNCSKRDTPENKRMAKIDLKDLHKGETWPHLSLLKLIPLSDSFEQELLAREESEELAKLFKAAEGNATAGVQPVKNQTENSTK